MDHQDPRVDRSRGAVYQAEDAIARIMARPHRAVRLNRTVLTLPEEIRFGTLETIQAFVDAVVQDAVTSGAHPTAGPVSVRPRRGFRMATYSQGTINIPAADPRGRWALTRGVVLHEVAHHLAGEPGHAATFRSTLVALYRRHVSEAAAAMLEHLFAPLEDIPDPTADTDADDDQVRRVGALLAKAEGTASAEEAEAYLAKAALVAQRHSVDMAVAAMGPDARRTEPTHRMLSIGEPRKRLNPLLISLLVRIAHPWGVRVDIGPGSTYAIVYGMPADLDRVESVFATAGAMMLARAHAHVRSGAWRGTTYRPPEGGPSRPVTAAVARNAFVLGFLTRLGGNLQSARDTARADAAAPSPGPDDDAARAARVDLAIRSRDLAVSDYHRTTSRARGTWRGSTSAAGSAAASRRAGERAADEFGRRAVGGGRRAIEG